jgi:hypothetical protein
VREDEARLPKREEVFVFPVAGQTLGDGLNVGFDPVIAQRREGFAVPLTSEDRIDDGEAGFAGHIIPDTQDIIGLAIEDVRSMGYEHIRFRVYDYEMSDLDILCSRVALSRATKPQYE